MTATRTKATVAVGTLGAAVLLFGGYSWMHSESRLAAAQWGLLDRYCVDCHNDDEWTADVAFNVLDPGAIGTEPELFEEVVRKLRGRMMPPSGSPSPSAREYDTFVAWLESTLDANAAAQPTPGRVALHRLNRTEYANAVRDLFGLEVDPTALLPKDDESDGFDNIASVLKVSPSFLDQYIAAARVVSQMAVGDAAAKLDSRVYYAEPTSNQNYHIDGMPLGTRGGMLITHQFPVAGEYSVSIGGLARARYVEGMEYRHRLIVAVDGVKVFEDQLGGKEDMHAIDLHQASAVGEIAARFENIPFTVSAGPHEIAVTFVGRTMSEMDTVLQPFVPGGGEVGIIEGEPSPLKVQRVQIDGPLRSVGVGSTPSRQRIMICSPAEATEEPGCAEQIVAAVARRAFRRPVGEADLEVPMNFYRAARQQGDFDAGIRAALTMILASPDFLFRSEPVPEDAAPGTRFDLDDFSLASRLSFFLWSSIPDEELLAVAESGRLGEPAVMRAQVERMLADPRAQALISNFAVQWLDVRGVAGIDPDPILFPHYNADLGADFEREIELFVASILLDDRSVLELFDAPHSFVNERLALHYGIDSVRGDQFRRIELPDPNRWGLFGKGGILMTTSYPNRTAPVLRGAWILESLLGTPPPAPPPNVEAFPETEEGGAVLTVRERLEAHRDNPSCRGCHDVMDPLGFALENFDAIGQWRERDYAAGEAIDASGRLADGSEVTGPIELREALLANPDQLVQTLTEKLMIFGLGRGLEYYDMPAVRDVVRAARRDDYVFSSVLTGIVLSEPFRRGTVPTAEPAG